MTYRPKKFTSDFRRIEVEALVKGGVNREIRSPLIPLPFPLFFKDLGWGWMTLNAS